MILYHGSNMRVATPDTRHANKSRGKDFGCGFYLSDSFRMASSFAKQVVCRSSKGKATVSSYEIFTCLLTLRYAKLSKKAAQYSNPIRIICIFAVLLPYISVF